MTFGFTIEETTGSKRRVTLHGRALPYQGVAWAGAQRTKLTWYPGNPTATLQVLGAEEEPTEINGMWKDRYLPGQVDVAGFPEVRTAEELVAIFEALRIAGNALRVQWGPNVREGILKRFSASYARLEDVSWEATFEWFARNEGIAPRLTARPPQISDLRQRLNAIDDQLAFEPPGISLDYRSQILGGINTIRQKAGVVFDGLRAINALARTPAFALGAIASAVDSIRFEAEDEIGRLENIPRETVHATDRVADVLVFEGWRRTLAHRVFMFRGSAQERHREVKEQAKPGALKFITVPGDTTLRQIALAEYGSADSWQEIADANGFDGSIVPAGTVVIIPPPKGGVRVNV